MRRISTWQSLRWTGLAVSSVAFMLGCSATWAQTLFSEDYASGTTINSAFVPSTVMNGGNSATPTIEIQNFIVGPDFNNGSNQGPPILTFDAMADPGDVPTGFQAIDFDGPAHPDDPGGYSEILAEGNWWTDNPTTFFHQNASVGITPQIASRNKVYVLGFSVGMNLATASDEGFGARIGLFDDKDQGVNLGNNFNNENVPRRPNQLNVHRINSDGENVHINTGNFSSGFERLHYGQYVPISPPVIDFADFKLRAEDQSGVLSHLFQDEAVIRFHELDQGRMSVEWFVEASIPTDPQDPTSTPFGGDEGSRPELDGWHNFTTLENIFDLSGPDKVPLGDFTKLRISLWNPDNGTDGWTVSDLDTIHTDRAGQVGSNHQVGFGHIILNEYHVGDVDRSGSVTAADVTDTPLLGKLGIMTDRVWSDGETTGDDRVTVSDALAGVLTGLSGAAPTGPELTYNSGTGNLQIDTGGLNLSGFALVAGDGNTFTTGSYNNPNPNPGTAIETVENFELSWMNLTTNGTAAGSNLSGPINLGNVLPTGLSAEELEAFFAEAVFNVSDALSKANSFFATAPPVLAGDYNGDNVVNAADYGVWLANLGSSDPLLNDLIGGTIGLAHYEQWKDNLGSTSPGTAQNNPVPEPTSLLLASVGMLTAACWKKWRKYERG